MKTIITTIFLLITSNTYAQTCDVLYIPQQKSMLVTYQNLSPFGFYLGGYLKTTSSEPFIYTTPTTIINRLGLTLNYRNKISLIAGVNAKKLTYNTQISPDFWIRINPLRTILKVEKGPDFSVAIGYSDKVNLGVGISLNFW